MGQFHLTGRIFLKDTLTFQLELETGENFQLVIWKEAHNKKRDKMNRYKETYSLFFYRD